MYGIRISDYVPEPEPVSSDYIVACHHFPGWQKDAWEGPIQGFDDIVDYPSRTPLLGYYQDSDAEAVDWQIKWAVEHGINCFVYCWYRRDSNEGKPVDRDGLFFEEAIHDGLFHARYRDLIKFAIMWECDIGKGCVSDEKDLLDNLLPFWVDNYFTKNYLILDNKPYVFVYAPERLIRAFGSAEACRQGFEKCSEKAKEYGYDGIVFFADNNSLDAKSQEILEKSGFSCSFQYCWDMIIDKDPDRPDKTYAKVPDDVLEIYKKNDYNLPEDYAVDTMLKMMEQKLTDYPDTSIITASSMRDCTPWMKYGHDVCPNGLMGPVARYTLSPGNWKKVLEGMKALTLKYPEGSFGRKMIMLDNWNEWSEGHFIAPSLGGGFKYLQAVREVFSKMDNLPDYRTHEHIGIGPYDSVWK